MRSPDVHTWRNASLRPLLAKELREIVGGRALWTMLLLVCPLVGYSFFQAVSLYADASGAAAQSPVVASSLSPLDGVLVPTFGSFYVATTLLFPFVAIRALGQEKESGALRLLVQLPYRSSTLVATKLTAIAAAWMLTSIPALSALAVWIMLGGHLASAETLTLVLGHLLYGLLVGAIALFSASVSESAATAAIIALAFTIGSWVLDFTVAGRPGLLEWVAQLSLTQTLRPFEQGLLSAGLVLGIGAVIGGLCALATVWLPPGVAVRTKLTRSTLCVLATMIALACVAQVKRSVDVAEDRRNSFSLADQRQLAKLTEPLTITVHFAPEDPRYVDLRRNVLSKLERALPNVTIRLAAAGQSMVGSTSDESYGEIEYSYGGRSAKTRSTSHREALPLIYQLAGKPIPTPVVGEDYPGHPLVANGQPALLWFCGGLPLLIVIAWWWSGRPPRIPASLIDANPIAEGGKP